MAIILKKDLEVANSGNVAPHWIVTTITHDLENEQVRIEIIGYNSKAERLSGKSPIPGSLREYVIKNTPDIPAIFDPDGIEVQPAISGSEEYTKYKNHKLSEEDLALNPTVRSKRLEKSQILKFLETIPDFADATDDE